MIDGDKTGDMSHRIEFRAISAIAIVACIVGSSVSQRIRVGNKIELPGKLDS
jgi:hypothetical protein